MASTTVAPVVAPAAPSAPAPAAPAASAPPSPPSTPSTPVTPSTPSTPETQPGSQSIETALQSKWDAYKASPENPANAETAPVEAEAAPAVAAPTEGAAAPAEAAPVEGEVAAPVEGAAPADEAEDLTQYQVDYDEPTGPKDLSDWVAKPENAAVKDALDANPTLKNAIYGALRRDSENRELRTIVPTVEAAKAAVGGATTLLNIDSAFDRATDDAGAKGFFDQWVTYAMVTNDKGEVLKNPDGTVQIKPQLFKILDTVYGNKNGVLADGISKTGQIPQELTPIINAMEAYAKTSGDERYQSVAEFLKEVQTPSSSAPVEVPAELKSLADSLKAKETALTEREQAATRQRSEEARAANQASADRATERVNKTVDGLLEQSFTKAGLSDAEAKLAKMNIEEAIMDKLGRYDAATGKWKPGGNRFFQTVLDEIASRPPGAEREAAIHKHFMSSVTPLLGSITAAELRSIKSGAIGRQTATADKVAAQVAASREVPKGTSTAPAAPQTSTPAGLRASIEKEYADANNGAKPSLDYLTEQMMKRSGAFKAGA